jgi:hypothetical protein
LERDGALDMHSSHGTFPTILVVKVVANKWIKEEAQVWKRHCIWKAEIGRRTGEG